MWKTISLLVCIIVCDEFIIAVVCLLQVQCEHELKELEKEVAAKLPRQS